MEMTTKELNDASLIVAYLEGKRLQTSEPVQRRIDPLIMKLRFEISNEEWKITSVQYEARMVVARKELADGKGA